MIDHSAPPVGSAARPSAIDVELSDGVRRYAATCPHMGAPLEQGRVEGGNVVCPWHRYRYDAKTGAGQGPARLLGLCLRAAPEGAETIATLAETAGELSQAS
ncbi:MAG: Rieske (2Fe-2S) protein [Chloroflexota bacterium]